MNMVIVERVSDGVIYRTNGNIADFDIEGEPVKMSRDVAELWERHAKFPIRLIPVVEEK